MMDGKVINGVFKSALITTVSYKTQDRLSPSAYEYSDRVPHKIVRVTSCQGDSKAVHRRKWGTGFGRRGVWKNVFY